MNNNNIVVNLKGWKILCYNNMQQKFKVKLEIYLILFSLQNYNFKPLYYSY